MLDMMKLNTTWGRDLVIFLFSFAVLFGPAYALFDAYDYDVVANPDLTTYLGLAEFDFDQSPTRKYRVIVPFLAAGIHSILGGLFRILSPDTFPGPDFAMCMSFLVVNSLLMSFYGLLVYRLCRAFGTSAPAAIIGLLCVLTCRWTASFAGLPLVDSLYLVVVAMCLLGIQSKDKRWIIASIFIGPWAKESFIFFAPIVFWFSSMKKWRLALLFALSGAMVFTARYGVDMLGNPQAGLGLEADIEHFENVPVALRRLFSFHGVYELVSIVGIWGLLFLALLRREVRLTLSNHTHLYLVLFLVVVLIHALLSTQLARMFYLATPVIAIWIALICDEMFHAIGISPARIRVDKGGD